MTIVHVGGRVYMIDAEYHGRNGVLGTYVVKGDRSMVIDPGPTASIPGVVEGLEELGIRHGDLAYVAATHIHLDHTGGAWKLLELFPEARLHVHPRGSQHIADPRQLESAARQFFGDRVDDYGEIRGVPPNKITESSDGEWIDLGGARVRVIWTPGHSTHHQSYCLTEEGVTILGDAGGFYSASPEVIMPTSHPPFNPVKAVESLDRLIALAPDVVCYSHFGFAGGGVEKLRMHRSQILLWCRIVEDGLNEGLEPEEMFKRVRSEDPMARRLGDFSRGREMASLSNIAGFIEYFRWLKKSKQEPSKN